METTDDDELTTLTDIERDRARAFRNHDDKRDFLAGHLLVRRAAAMLTGASASTFVVEQHCDRCGGPHGRPHLRSHPNLSVSLSHTNGVAAAACNRGPIGVDIEHWSNVPVSHGELGHVLTDAERELLNACAADVSSDGLEPDQLAFLRFWVRKESLVKFGALTLDTLSTVDLSDLPLSESTARRWCRRVSSGPWKFLEWSDPALRISGCAVGDGHVRLVEIAR